MNSNPLPWTDITIALGTVAAIVISLVSLYFSAAAKSLADKQEKRRTPKLIPLLGQAYVRSLPDQQIHVYAFYLTVSNPMDANNAISLVDLNITYLNQSNTIMTVKLRAEPSDDDKFMHKLAKHLAAPIRVAAHDTVSGWCYFRVEAALLKGMSIDGYELILTDTQGQRSQVEPIMIQEYRDAL
jgi:hypothetical protein